MSKRSDDLYIQDILECIHAIESYVSDMDYQTFFSDRKTYSATIRELQIIGEASCQCSEVLKKANSHIDWRTIKDFRNVLIHQYFGVDSEILWDIIQNKVPQLKIAIGKIRIL